MNILNKKIQTKPSILYKKKQNFLVINKRNKTKLCEGTIDYKNVVLLRKYISAEGKILPRRLTGVTAKQQRLLTKAIKNARMIGLIPFINYSGPM